MKSEASKKLSKNLPEELLIDFALSGNQRAYTLIFERHEHMLRKVIGRYLHQVEEIEECLQDTLVRMYRGLPNFRREAKMSTWLHQIATFTAINYYRSKTRQYSMTSVETMADYNQLQDLEPSVMVKLQHNDLAYWIQDALQSLSKSDATVLQQYYLNEWSVDEICQATGLTESNIKTRLMRARQRLREVVERQYRYQLLN